jgi:hypothetical protein
MLIGAAAAAFAGAAAFFWLTDEDCRAQPERADAGVAHAGG